MAHLSDIYYQPTNLWTGNKAIKLLQKESKLTRNKVVQWLAKQDLWQVHIPPPRHVIDPHYMVKIPNQIHRFDLLFMPGDKLYGNKYKYVLTGC